MDCYNQKTKVSFFLKYEETDKYVSFSPDDARTLLEACTGKKLR
jgi:hypothetical protein